MNLHNVGKNPKDIPVQKVTRVVLDYCTTVQCNAFSQKWLTVIVSL